MERARTVSEFNFFGLDFMHYTIFNMGRVPDPVYVRWTLQGNVALCSTSEVALASTKQCLSYMRAKCLTLA